jgi:hypothetical protein
MLAPFNRPVDRQAYFTLGGQLGRVSYLLMEEEMVIVGPKGGPNDGRGSSKVSTLSE